MEALKTLPVEPVYTPERPRGMAFDENGNAIGYMDCKEAEDIREKFKDSRFKDSKIRGGSM